MSAQTLNCYGCGAAVSDDAPNCLHCGARLASISCPTCFGMICRAHGTWFELNELHRIVHFIRAGGLDRARSKEKAELAEERRRLQAARLNREADQAVSSSPLVKTDLLSLVVCASSDLLSNWLDH